MKRFFFLSLLAISISFSVNSQGFFGEAPQLAEMVASGDLPIVDERLPVNPLLIQPEEEVGIYGGTWYFGMLNVGDAGTFHRIIGYEGLLRWDPQWTRIVPNVAQSYEASEDATTFTFVLREGMKWSDGMPFTSADVVFWAEATNQNGVTVTAIDETTVQFIFDEPNGLYPQRMATLDGRNPVRFPAHYLSQFHIDYNDEAETMASEAGFNNWRAHFNNRADYHRNPELPTLNPWILTEPYPTENDTIEAVRNPYYWKIDTDFNQLPYIDRVVFRQFETTDEITEWALTGEVGAQDRYIGTRNNRAMFESVADDLNLGFYTLVPAFSNVIMIALNYNTPDPVLVDLIAELDFRVALSHAIHRERIINEVFDGEGIPYQIAPPPESPFYHERLATQYLEYDVELANELLDGLGLTDRDADGFRLRPDGERLVIPFIIPDINVDYPVIISMIAEDWQAIGVELTWELIPRQEASVGGSEHVGVVWDADGGVDVVLSPRYYVPQGSGADYYAARWVDWFQNPENEVAVEPPEIVQDQVALYRLINSSVDPEVQADYMNQVLDIAADQFYVMGIASPQALYGLVSNNFGNVPSVMPLAFRYPTPAPSNPEQYFIRNQ